MMDSDEKALRAEHPPLIAEDDQRTKERAKDDRRAQSLYSPSVSAVGAVDNWMTLQDENGDEPSIRAQMDHLAKLADAAGAGDQTQSIKMLTTQMATLNILFNTLAQHAGANRREGYLGACEIYLKLAFKAQSQARSAAEALNDILHPRTTTFVKQTNTAENMQINNGPRAEKCENAPNELLEQKHGERLDFGTQSMAVEDDADMATVGKSDRAANKARKSSGKS